ncbi:2-hydroxychromene-2-carboxylate isomerase [Erythrobacter litoralis]|uniref:2-hydroxychromene-2-carboxylate isomerase n=1 Tax=Erythrobacter litoralis TaxID=39960 RepID=UPI002435677A|nr:2-hydroxychromene-2-carboxylate isomerase [Erythrobacter litoralis]MDG6078494.1 2-hydroxychromene-2-carboxylate isomerase [Erythrobacter litoralis]
MTQTVEFILDVGAPNGYLAWYPLHDLIARTGAELVVTPVFLGGMHKLTGNAPPMHRDAEVKGKVEYAELEFHRFIARHGLTHFRMHPDLPFNSILPQRCLVAADSEQERQTMADALLRAIWESNIDCRDPDAVRACLDEAGFDGLALIARTQDDAIKQTLADNTSRAVERGAFGIPTFFVGDEMWFGKERLEQVERYLDCGKA